MDSSNPESAENAIENLTEVIEQLRAAKASATLSTSMGHGHVGRLWTQNKDEVWRESLYGIYGSFLGMTLRGHTFGAIRKEENSLRIAPNVWPISTSKPVSPDRQTISKCGLDLVECDAVYPASFEGISVDFGENDGARAGFTILENNGQLHHFVAASEPEQRKWIEKIAAVIYMQQEDLLTPQRFLDLSRKVKQHEKECKEVCEERDSIQIALLAALDRMQQTREEEMLQISRAEKGAIMLAEDLVEKHQRVMEVKCREVKELLAGRDAKYHAMLKEGMEIKCREEKELLAGRDAKYNKMLQERVDAEDKLRDEIDRLKEELVKEKCVGEERVSEEKQRRTEQAKRMIVQRLQHSKLAYAFDSYAYRVSKVRRQREACRRVVLRMQHVALAGALDMFLGTVGQLKANRQIVEKAMGRWRTPAMATAMWAWMEYMEVVAQERKDEALDAARNQLSGMSEMAKNEKKELDRAVEEEKQRRTEQAKRIVQRLLHSQLAYAFDSYAYRVSEVRKQRETCRRVVLRMQHVALAGALDMFLAMVGQLKVNRQIVEKAMGRWRTPAMATAMWAWMEYMEVVAQERKDEALDAARNQLSGMSEMAKTLQESQDQAQELLAKLEESETRYAGLLAKLEESETRYANLPVVVALKYDADFDVVATNPEAAAKFDAHVQEQVSSALGIPKTAVQVMCHQRGSVIAEVVLKRVTRPGGDSNLSRQGLTAPLVGPRTPALLAQELVGMVNDRSSILCRKVLGSLAVKSAVIDGPIAERLSDVVASASCKALELLAGRDAKYNEMLEERMDAEDKFRDEIDRLKNELSSASVKALELLSEIHAKYNGMLNQAGEQLMDANGKQQDEIVRLKTELSSTSDKALEMQQKIDELTLKLQSANAQVADLTRTLSSAHSEVAAHQNIAEQLQNIAGQLKQSRREADELRKDKARLSGTTQQLLDGLEQAFQMTDVLFRYPLNLDKMLLQILEAFVAMQVQLKHMDSSKIYHTTSALDQHSTLGDEQSSQYPTHRSEASDLDFRFNPIFGQVPTKRSLGEDEHLVASQRPVSLPSHSMGFRLHAERLALNIATNMDDQRGVVPKAKRQTSYLSPTAAVLAKQTTAKQTKQSTSGVAPRRASAGSPSPSSGPRG